MEMADGSYAMSTNVHAKIPTCFILNKHASLLQEGAVHVLSFNAASQSGGGLMWGAVHVLRQERGGGRLTKDEAAKLMEQFFSARKQERQEEAELIQKTVIDENGNTRSVIRIDRPPSRDLAAPKGRKGAPAEPGSPASPGADSQKPAESGLM